MTWLTLPCALAMALVWRRDGGCTRSLVEEVAYPTNVCLNVSTLIDSCLRSILDVSLSDRHTNDHNRKSCGVSCLSAYITANMPRWLGDVGSMGHADWTDVLSKNCRTGAPGQCRALAGFLVFDFAFFCFGLGFVVEIVAFSMPPMKSDNVDHEGGGSAKCWFLLVAIVCYIHHWPCCLRVRSSWYCE